MSITFTFSVVGSSSPATTSASDDDGANVAGALAIRDKALDHLTGDLLATGGGDQSYNFGIAAIASDLRSRWIFFKRDWFLDLNKGIDYWGVIFNKDATDEARAEEYRREGLATPGVVAIDIRLERLPGRVLDVRGVVTADTGEIFKVALGVNAGP